MLTLLTPIETQGSEHWVLIERQYTRPEELSLLKVATTQQEESGAGHADIFADGRLSKVDVLVDKFKVEVATEETVETRRTNTQQRGRVIASPEDIESVWEERPWSREGLGGASLAASCALVEKLQEGSQLRVGTGEAIIRNHHVSAGQQESHTELSKELEEFQTCGRPTAPGTTTAEVDLLSPASDKGVLQSFLLDPAHAEARADSSDETDTSFAERSFCLNYGEKDSEDQVLPSHLEEREEHPVAAPVDETRLELLEELPECSVVNSSDQPGSAAGLGRNKDETHTTSSEKGTGPPKKHGRPDDLKAFVEQLSKGPSPEQTFAENWEEVQQGVGGELTHPIASASKEEETPVNGDLRGKVEKSSSAELKNHSPDRRRGVHPDLEACALPCTIPPNDVSKPAKLGRERGLFHTQTGEPATEDNEASAFLQMEVITPIPVSPDQLEALAAPEEASQNPAPHGSVEPLELRDPFGDQRPVFLKHVRSPNQSLDPKDLVRLVVAPDGGERRAPPITSRKPRIVPEEAEGAIALGLVFSSGNQKEMTSFQAGGQEGSLEDISKTSVANKIRIFETHGAETSRASQGETKAFPNELSPEASTGQVEEQRNKLLDLGVIQLQPPGDFASPKVTLPSMMLLATRHFGNGISTTSHQERCMELEFLSPDSGCETTLEEATGNKSGDAVREEKHLTSLAVDTPGKGGRLRFTGPSGPQVSAVPVCPDDPIIFTCRDAELC
ncbi:uncharacterized protein LOC126067185 [Elephas maximus indicus]|uniref:uncharacterized protein LOC126067185 n=1 Tax=Elephas maximus indicus TaxID=99487 RepID=UPI0021161D02|nr:uncharacterized protein LOC126067185 [Elephas maximus indicus]